MKRRQAKLFAKRAYAIRRLEYRTAEPLWASGLIIGKHIIVRHISGIRSKSHDLYEVYVLTGTN